MDRSQSVSLGCGTLILIVLIVAIFGNMATNEIQTDVQRIDRRMERMERLLEAQSAILDELKAAIEASGPEQGDAAQSLEDRRDDPPS